MILNWKDKVTSRFEARAEEYDNHSDFQKESAQQLALHLPNLDNPDILEIGCGPGSFTKYLLKKYSDGKFQITDISSHMVESARQNFYNSNINHSNIKAQWCTMDGENPQDLGDFDIIACNMVVQWFERPKESLAVLATMLKPGGVLVYAAPGPSCFNEWEETLSHMNLRSGLLDFKILPGIFKEDRQIVNYGTALNFLQKLKMTGAITPRKGYTYLSYSELAETCRYFDKNFKGMMTWHIIYGCIHAANI